MGPIWARIGQIVFMRVPHGAYVGYPIRVCPDEPHLCMLSVHVGPMWVLCLLMYMMDNVLDIFRYNVFSWVPYGSNVGILFQCGSQLGPMWVTS